MIAAKLQPFSIRSSSELLEAELVEERQKRALLQSDWFRVNALLDEYVTKNEQLQMQIDALVIEVNISKGLK